jgi:hypothetical protein
VFETQLPSWLSQKSIELLGVEEQSFSEMVMNLLKKQAKASKVIDTLEQILMDGAEPFVVKLWRFIIFEQLKLKYRSKIESV